MAASVDALEALCAGKEAWAEWSSEQAGRIDLRLAELDTMNITGFRFESCDFGGSSTEGVNLDGSEFIDCTFKSMSLVHASFVDVRLARCTFIDVDLDRVVIRGAMVEDCSFSRLEPARLSFDQSEILRCTLTDGPNVDLGFKNSTLAQCRVESFGGDLTLTGGSANELVVRTCDFTTWLMATIELFGGRFEDVTSETHDWASTIGESVKFTRVDPGPGESQDVAFLDCRIYRSALVHLGLTAATLTGSSIVDCDWPEQKPSVSWSGGYRRAPDLMKQSVQDVVGVGPIRRREIADAQYVDELHLDAIHSRLKRVALRLWGLSSEFGQSLLRLTIWVITSIAILTTAHFVLGRLSDSAWEIRAGWPDWCSEAGQFRDSFIDISGAFFGFNQVDMSGPGLLVWIYWLSRLLGFVALGVLIGVASTRLGRLSSE